MPQYVSYSPNKFQASYIPYHEMSATVNKCQVSYPEMLGTYPVYQVYMKLSGSEMSYT